MIPITVIFCTKNVKIAVKKSILAEFKLEKLNDMEAASFCEKFSTCYEKKENVCKILLFQTKEKLYRYLPKTIFNTNLTNKTSNFGHISIVLP